MFSVVIAVLMWPATKQEMILPTPLERLKPGMTQAEVEKLLNEKPQNVVWFGAIGYANITCDYLKNRVQVEYNADFRVKSITRMPQLVPKKEQEKK